MHINVKYCVVGLALLAATIPVSARTYKQSVVFTSKRSIGSTQLKPGSYDLSADDTKMELNILQNGKIVATVQGQWVKIPQKAQGSELDADHDKITQVRFRGSDQAFQLP
jgi:hypothetical protein